MTTRYTEVSNVWDRYLYELPPPDPDMPPGPEDAGADTIGSTNYSVPQGAIFVAVNGSDTTGDGTQADPYGTLTKAYASVAANGTIVMRAGIYEQGTTAAASLGLTIQKAGVTIQNYPNEAVWIDGSTIETNWVADGARWRKDLVRTFDRSPTYSRGATDSTTPGWQWVNPSFPCAPWPEQVFIDGVAQEQVATLAEVTAGKFYVAGSGSGTNNMTFTSSAYYIGTNPSGKEIRVGHKVAAITCLETNIMIRGIGIRRFSNSVPDFGVVKLYRNGCSMEQVVVEDCATTGVWLYTNNNATLSKVTITRSGLVGGGADRSDYTTLDRCLFTYNTKGRFNSAPVSGGWKAAHCQYYTVTGCDISNNWQHGLWFDETVYQMDIVGCNMRNNGGYGGISEISEGARWLNCLITGNARGGLLIQGTNNSEVWNCTLADNGGASFKLIQDPRRPSDGTGRDGRMQYPEWYNQNCTWVITSFKFNNSVSDDPGNQAISTETGYGFYIVSQESPKKGWESFGPQMNGNLYSRTVSNVPVNMFLLAQTGANAAGWSTLPPYKTVVAPREEASVEIRGTNALQADFMPTTATNALLTNVPIGLPANIAALIGVPTGTRHVGAWR